MIVFDLKCEHGHQFESWFRSSSDYAEQQERGLIGCPMCDSANVSKAVMAPNVAAKGNQKLEHTMAANTETTSLSASVPAGGVSTPNPVAKPKDSTDGPNSAELQKLHEKMAEVATAVRTYVEKNCDDVGDQFADEARKIHYGETEERGIYGNATADEAQELIEEGIDLLPLPDAKRLDA